MARRTEEDMLVHLAKAVLDFNWTGEYTMPGPRLYPHQWSWDSAFVAIGYSRYDQDHATRELRHLFESQWKNGLLPQLVFNPRFTNMIGHDKSIRTGGIRSLDAFVFCRDNPYMFRDAMLKLLLAETLPYKQLIQD